MQTETFTYSSDKQAWSLDTFPELNSPQTLVMVFGSSNFFDVQDPIQELIRHYPDSHIIGCSTSGEIHGNIITDNSLSVAVSRFDHTQLKSSRVAIASNEDIVDATQQIVDELLAPKLRGVFLLGSGLNLNFALIVRQLQTLLGKDVIITGGVSGDAERFERTWVLDDGQSKENMLTAVAFYGDAIHIGYGSKGGWQPRSVPMLITKAEDNILYELNGHSALKWYKHQIRRYDVQLPAGALYFPLAVRQSITDRDYIVRTILGIDEASGGMIFAGEIKKRYFAQFMSASQTELVNGAKDAASFVNQYSNLDNSSLSVAISCVGRRLVLDHDTPNELNAVLDILGTNMKQVGFYSYGEICPSVLNGYSELHNQTMTLTVFSEA